MAQRRFLAAIIALAAIGLAACLPVTTKVPVGSTVKAQNDEGLAGVWRGRVGTSKTATYFTFIPQKDGTMVAVFVTPTSPQEEGEWGAFAIQTVTLGPNQFMNVRQTVDQGKPATGSAADNNVPVLYRLSGDSSLTFYIIDEDAAKAAIKAGKINGTIGQGQFGDVMLTAPPGALDTFMASPAGRALFGKKPLAVLHRVK